MEYAGINDIGLIRSINQDAIYMAAASDIGIFCVADGMGGHSRGEIASREITSAIAGWWDVFDERTFDFDFFRMMDSLHQTIELANRTIYFMRKEDEICGSTVAALFVYRDNFGILSAGDSRIYLYERMRLKQLTVDEVWENLSGQHLGNEMFRHHPNKGKLVNAIGISSRVKITSTTASAHDGMIFMLCSDGLYKLCVEREIKSRLRDCKKIPLKAVAEHLLQSAYEKGAKDNVSVILVKI